MEGIGRTLISHKLLAPLSRIRNAWRERQFRALPKVHVDATALGACDDSRLQSLLNPRAVLGEWIDDQAQIARLDLPLMTGGVNPGDQRALHALTLGLRSNVVLEIGTHLGCSTVALALAARRLEGQVVTCDISDVNDEAGRPWTRYGSSRSPRSAIEEIGCSAHVQFVNGDSLKFFQQASPAFDLIFLDGNHDASHVYRELPLAMRALRTGGHVLLHDYYPENLALWSDDPPISGPFRAVNRLLAEGAAFQVLPLGELDWPTRSGSRVTSLALVTATS